MVNAWCAKGIHDWGPSDDGKTAMCRDCKKVQILRWDEIE